MRPRRRPLTNNDIESVVLKCRIKNLLQHRLHAVDFINKKHLFVLQIGQNGSQVALDLQRRSRRRLKRRSHFVGNDVRQGRLAQARRPVEQNVIERLAARLCRFYRDR